MERLGTTRRIDMPELPEVETVRRILEPIVKGETIASIKVYREKNILTGADLFVSSLIGEKFLSVSRVGKYLLFHLTNDKVIVSLPSAAYVQNKVLLSNRPV